MPSVVSERLELGKLCSSKDWSKAIRLLDSILSSSCVLQDLCNRAFCYSRLELHKHVIKDCDKALQLDPQCLQAYLLKCHALLALGKKEDALLVREQEYEHALCQSADLKQLVELEELLAIEKQNNKIGGKQEKESDLPTLNVQSRSQSNGYINESFVNHCKFIDLPSRRGYASEISGKLIGNHGNCNEMSEKFIGNGNSN